MTIIATTRPSRSAVALARALGARRVRVDRWPIRRKHGDVINWGNTWLPPIPPNTNLLNLPNNVSKSVDKILAFEAMKAAEIPTVDFTTNVEDVRNWLRAGKTVYARLLTKASGGRGITLIRPGDTNILRAPLYTKFWRCDREIRVHVVGNQVIDFAEKRRRRVDNPPALRYWIRTYDNGWIYAREGAEIPDAVKQVAVKAIAALGLNFGAVDMRVRNNGKCRVLEVNSAPGMSGITLQSYANALRRIIRV